MLAVLFCRLDLRKFEIIYQIQELMGLLSLRLIYSIKC
ncbi:hypothetical protein MNBD_ALPHA11-2335 [hydrothermal vent metagenome]|uniref:Uncharacterized protein n=1 Tax=hydrothermal vent metagenome TaxID=652676 RepID=A0A3B0TX82_9ZZZZ